MMENKHPERSNTNSSNVLGSSTKIEVKSLASSLIREKYFDKQKLSNHTTIRLIENFIFIWFNSNLDNIDDNSLPNIDQIWHLINGIYLFGEVDECVNFLTDIIDEKIFIIIVDVISQYVVSSIYDLYQLHSISLFGVRRWS